jgi:hypothetical protein
MLDKGPIIPIMEVKSATVYDRPAHWYTAGSGLADEIKADNRPKMFFVSFLRKQVSGVSLGGMDKYFLSMLDDGKLHGQPEGCPCHPAKKQN